MINAANNSLRLLAANEVIVNAPIQTLGLEVASGSSIRIEDEVRASDGNVTLQADGDIQLNDVDAAELEVNSTGRIVGEGILTISGDASFTTSAANAGTVRVTNTGPVTIGTSTIGGELYVNSAGAITQAIGAPLQVAGAISINGGSSFPLVNTVGDPSQFTIFPNGDTVITQVGTAEIPAAAYPGNLTVNSLASGILSFNEVLTDDAIVLDQANTVGGTLRFNTAIGDAVTITGTPGIIQAGPIAVANTLSLDATTAGNIRLNETRNQFSDVAFIGNDVVLNSQDAIVLQNSSAVSDLTITTGGTLTQEGSLSVLGDTNLAVTLSQAGNVALNNTLETILGQSLIGGTLTLLGSPESQVMWKSLLDT